MAERSASVITHTFVSSESVSALRIRASTARARRFASMSSRQRSPQSPLTWRRRSVSGWGVGVRESFDGGRSRNHSAQRQDSCVHLLFISFQRTKGDEEKCACALSRVRYAGSCGRQLLCHPLKDEPTATLRQRWRWRMQRAKVHIPGIAEYRNVGVVVDRDDTYWHIEDDEGRTFFAQVAWSSVSDVKVGDRVEFEPIALS